LFRSVVVPALPYVVVMLAVGLPYWSVDYGGLNLPDALLGYGLLLLFVFAVWLPFSGRATLGRAILLAGSVPVAVVLLRVVVEVVLDPSSHNLWPFEVVIAVAIGAPIAVVGALLGRVVRGWVS
jgi:hypothetical protein